MNTNKNPWSWVPSLYFAEGVPYVVVTVVSLVIFKQMGLSNAAVTFYTAWLSLPWVIKPLWSPFVDLVKTKRFWILAMQLLMGASLGGVAFTLGTSWWFEAVLFLFFLMAFSSATHDIAADGFYMLGLRQTEQTWFVGIRSSFYRLATIFGQGVLVMIAGNLQVVFRKSPVSYSWSLVLYGTAALFIALWLWHCYILPKPVEDAPRKDVNAKQLTHEFGHTVVSFFRKPQIAVAIAFMLFFRMPEGLLSKVSALFLMDPIHKGGLGLSPQEFGLVQGTVGVFGLTFGGIVGGLVAGNDGLKKWLWPMVCAITLPDLVYVYLSYVQPANFFLINGCVFIEQFGYGFGFTAYMLYLIYYCQGEYKTSHYALCTAFMALSLFIPGLFAGALQEAVGFRTFFLIVMASCLLTFIVAALVDVDPAFGQSDAPDKLSGWVMSFVVLLILIFVFRAVSVFTLIFTGDLKVLAEVLVCVGLVGLLVGVLQKQWRSLRAYFVLVLLYAVGFSLITWTFWPIVFAVGHIIIFRLVLAVKKDGRSAWEVMRG